jgi:hypothetical protein
MVYALLSLAAIQEKRTPLTFRCNVQLYRNHATGQWDTAGIDPTGRGFLEESSGFVRPPNRHD